MRRFCEQGDEISSFKEIGNLLKSKYQLFKDESVLLSVCACRCLC